MIHLIIPFASNLDASCQTTLNTLQLPKLSHWLQKSEMTDMDEGHEFDLVPPHERALSRLDASSFIVITPCHWTVGIDHIRMDDPDALKLSEEESRSLFETVQPYFAEDGIALTYESPLRWQAHSTALNDVPFASLDRVIGRSIDAWQIPIASIRRLQNEMQMLFYTHPINDAREAKGLPTVNSFWISRCYSPLLETNTQLNFSLRDSALKGDWQAWAAAWSQLDQSLDFSAIDRLSLCGERHSQTYQIKKRKSLHLKIKHWFQSKISARTVLDSL